MTDITAILNVHAEGPMARTAMSSIEAAATAARTAGLVVELLAIADAADDATLATVDAPGWRVIQTDHRDLGLARNTGIAASQGHFIAFLDGDDLWTAPWLVEAHRAAHADPRPVVWHPEATLLFGPDAPPAWFIHPETESRDGDWVMLGIRNGWTALSFAPRGAYERTPYRANAIGAGFGYEDWSWNAETIAQGWLHRPVPGTAHLVRVRQDSLVRQSARAGVLHTPSTLLRTRVGWAARHGLLAPPRV